MATVKRILKNKTTVSNKSKIVPLYHISGEEPQSTISDCILGTECHYNGEINLYKDGKLIVQSDISDLPYCCGVLELGNLYTDKTCTTKELTEYLDALVNEAKGKTLIINTNGEVHSKRFDDALIKCKYFVQVKTFKNSSSNNTIKIWMSNND